MKKTIILIILALISLNIYCYDSKLAKRIIEINESYRLWDGFKIDIPILLYFEKDSEMELISESKVNINGFKLSSRENKYYIYHKIGKLGATQSFDLNYRIGDIIVLLYKIDYLQTYDSVISIMFHEYFHKYQQNHFKDNLKYKPITGDLPNEYKPYFYLEMLYLKNALLSLDESERRENINSFICVREEKYKKMKNEYIEFENGKERIEGSAKYVEIKTGISRYNSSRSMFVAGKLLSESKMLSLRGDASMFHYQSGAIQMFLLDRYNILWEKEIEKEGYSIYNIIKKNFNVGNCKKARKNISDTRGYLNRLFSELNTNRNLDLSRTLENYKKQRYVLINFNKKFSTIPPKGYTYDIKENYERIFTNAEIDMSKLNLDLTIRASICSMVDKKDDGRTEANGYKIPIKSLNDIYIMIDGKTIGISEIGSEREFKSISLDINIENVVHLQSKCGGSITKIDNNIEVSLNCK
ncbi:MAG: hypothetical protein KA059_08815 [Elusimicrobiales bacterium]|nr:hypothetical protein [Elusimicrobiales bacterium]